MIIPLGLLEYSNGDSGPDTLPWLASLLSIYRSICPLTQRAVWAPIPCNQLPPSLSVFHSPLWLWKVQSCSLYRCYSQVLRWWLCHKDVLLLELGWHGRCTSSWLLTKQHAIPCQMLPWSQWRHGRDLVGVTSTLRLDKITFLSQCHAGEIWAAFPRESVHP